MSAYLFNGMDEWFEKHHASTFYPKKKERKQSTTYKNVHYGNEYDKNTELVKTFNKNGHTISLWSDGNLTCDCSGWIYKRARKQRECIHVREVYGQLKGTGTPAKSKPKEVTQDELFDILRRAFA